MNVGEATVLTSSLINQIVSVPQGFRTLDITNTGGASITFLGNSPQGTIPLTPVTVGVTSAYSFSDVGKPYPSVIIDCTGSSADIVAVY